MVEVYHFGYYPSTVEEAPMNRQSPQKARRFVLNICNLHRLARSILEGFSAAARDFYQPRATGFLLDPPQPPLKRRRHVLRRALAGQRGDLLGWLFGPGVFDLQTHGGIPLRE